MTKVYIFLPLLFAFTCITKVSAEGPEFESKLFEKATLVYSDDFDGEKYKGRYGHHRAKKGVENGKLVIYPLDPERGYVLGMLQQIPEKFVCHFRFKRVSKNPGGSGFHIGNHKMIVSSNRDENKEIVEGYTLLLKKSSPGKSFSDPNAKKLQVNEWIDVVIEYQEGKMLLNINGSEKIYEDEMVSMDGSRMITFKSFSAESLQFDYVRLWSVTE